jgi:uncharacterized membrane protein
VPTIEAVIAIDAPAHRVFQILCDVERWPQWTATMQSIRRLDSGIFKVGSQARVVQPKIKPAIWTVIEMDLDRNFTWVTKAAGLRMEAGHRIESQPSGCRVTLTYRSSGLFSPIVGLLYGKLIAGYLNTEAQSLKKRSEAPNPA